MRGRPPPMPRSKGFNTARVDGRSTPVQGLGGANVRQVKIRKDMYPNWRLEIDDVGKVTWVGVERGPLTLHFEDKNYLVLKEAGHQWYYNQYNKTQYEPAKFVIFRKVYDFNTMEDYNLVEMLEFYVKAQT